MATDPVHFDTTEKAWFFWDESLSNRHGPFVSEEEARRAWNQYVASFHESVPDPDEEYV